MDIMRMALVVIVAYILGLGTGLVGGVVFSLKEFAAPVTGPVSQAGPSRSGERTPESTESSPTTERSPASTASSRGDRSPSAEASARPEHRASPAVLAASSPEPSATESETPPTDASSPTTSGAVSEKESPLPTPTPTPEAKPTETPEKPVEETATLVVVANKGKGFAVYVDGQKRGVTPMTIELPARQHTVKVAGGDKFKSWQAKVTPQPGSERTVEAQLVFIPPPAPPPEPVAAPAPRYYPPAPHYVPSGGGGGGGGGRPGVTGSSRW